MTNNNIGIGGLLNAIINGVHPVPPVPPVPPIPPINLNPASPAILRPNLDHSFRAGDQITESGIRHASLPSGAYRGYGKDVSRAGNNPVAVAEMGGMNWKVARRPLEIVGMARPDGTVGRKTWEGMVALVRSDTGKPLAPATDSYKPHQNPELLKTMCDFADASGLTLSRVGLFDGGARGFAVATSGVNREAKVGDVVSLEIILNFGHVPGHATRFAAWARELRCSNGMTVAVAGGKARFVHSAELTEAKIQSAMDYVVAATAGFEAHVDLLARLRQAPSNQPLDLLQLAQVFQPELAASISKRVAADQDVMGKKVLTSILEREDSQWIVRSMIKEHGERLLNAVIEATATQPGAGMTVGTAAHALSGVSHFNSNVRGRSAETGLEAHLFGNYGQSSHEALKVATMVMHATRN